MKKTIPLLILGTMMLGCNSKEILEPTTDYPAFVVIDGDTVKTRVEKDFSKNKNITNFNKIPNVVGETVLTFKDTKLPDLPSKKVDLVKLKSKKPELANLPFKYIAFGSSLTAGVRDGGYFNDGIETSYPNLIARQLGIKDFEQPKFDKEDYNGVGRLVLTKENPTGGPAPKFKMVSNNNGVENSETGKLVLRKVKNISNISNMAVADGERGDLLHGYNFDHKFENNFANRFFYEAQGVKGYTSYGDLTTVESAYTDLIKDFRGMDNGKFFYGFAHGPIGSYEEGVAYTNCTICLDNQLKLDITKTQGMLCIANAPDILDTPLFHVVSAKDVYSKLLVGKEYLFKDYNPDDCLFFMNTTLDSLLSPIVNIVLKEDIIKRVMNGEARIGGPIHKPSYYSDYQGIHSKMSNYNKELERLSSKYFFPIMDLNKLFKEIRAGKFYTDDGIKVESTYPGGNFYSLDGIYPTAFGQAVIANEFIKTINKFYKTDIPLINTKLYLEKIK